MKIFIDDSGGFSWTAHGVSLFCAVTISDRTFATAISSFSAWKSRQPYFTPGAELKGTDLSPSQQASFANSVVLNTAGLRLTLAGTKTTLFKKEVAEQFIRDSANVLRATAKSCDQDQKPLLVEFYKRMAKWIGERSPENLMWICCLGNAIHLSIQHAIVMFMQETNDREFEDIDILIDQSFIEKSTHVQFWQEWLRNFLHSKSRKEPMMVPKEWSQRDHPFNRKYGRARGMRDWSDLYRNHTHFVNSKDSLGVQIADVCANICYRFHSGNPKYRPYRLLRSRISGKHSVEIHYGILNESSLLTDPPENHVTDYSEEALAAMAEIHAKRVRIKERSDD
jgi:Protein of unknown function (DUF3800)